MAFGQCPCWYFLYLSDLKVINLIFQSKILVLGYFGLKKTTKLSLSDPLALFIIYAMYSTTLICFLGRQCCEYNAFPYGALLSRGLRDHKDLLSTSLPYQVPSLTDGVHTCQRIHKWIWCTLFDKKGNFHWSFDIWRLRTNIAL